MVPLKCSFFTSTDPALLRNVPCIASVLCQLPLHSNARRISPPIPSQLPSPVVLANSGCWGWERQHKGEHSSQGQGLAHSSQGEQAVTAQGTRRTAGTQPGHPADARGGCWCCQLLHLHGNRAAPKLHISKSGSSPCKCSCERGSELLLSTAMRGLG